MSALKLVSHPLKQEELRAFASVFIEELMETGNNIARTVGGKERFEEHCVVCEPYFLSEVLRDPIFSSDFVQPIAGRRDLRVQHSMGSISISASTHPIRGYAIKNRPWMWTLKKPPLSHFMEPPSKSPSRYGFIPTFRESMEQHLRAELALYSEAFGWRSDCVDVYMPVLLLEMGATFRWGSLQPPSLADRTVDCNFRHADLGDALFLVKYDWMHGRELVNVVNDPEFVKREGDW